VNDFEKVHGRKLSPIYKTCGHESYIMSMQEQIIEKEKMIVRTRDTFEHEQRVKEKETISLVNKI
jgi:hypothetical protein